MDTHFIGVIWIYYRISDVETRFILLIDIHLIHTCYFTALISTEITLGPLCVALSSYHLSLFWLQIFLPIYLVYMFWESFLSDPTQFSVNHHDNR